MFAIGCTMYVEAEDEKVASGIAELNAFAASEAIRKVNSTWVQDEKSKLLITGVPEPIHPYLIPTIKYSKPTLIEAFGEDKSISFLNHISSEIHK